jgi:3-hydroxyisobutyrate dehydrogenase
MTSSRSAARPSVALATSPFAVQATRPSAADATRASAAPAARPSAAQLAHDRPRRVAFVGLGHMGSHMCRNVTTAGHEVTAFDLDRRAVRAAARTGARAAQSLAECVEGAEVLITSLPGPPQVRSVLCGPDGAIARLDAGALVIEMSTSSREVGREVLAAARARRIDFVDAPVAGQTIRAESGTLAIYAGGSKKAFGRSLHLLEAMGDPLQIYRLGPSGSGYAVKLLLNLMWFMHAIATAEALTVGVQAGVDLETLHTALVHSPANSGFLERDVRMVLDRGDYDEGFAMKLVTKDLGLAVDLARDAGVPVEMASLVEQMHRRARLHYGDDAGEMSVIRLYEDAVGVSLRARSAPPVQPATTSPDS